MTCGIWIVLTWPAMENLCLSLLFCTTDDFFSVIEKTFVDFKGSMIFRVMMPNWRHKSFVFASETY